MPKRRLAEEKLADKLTAIAVAHLDSLSPEEREGRIRAFEKKVSTVGKKGRGAASSASTSYTRPNPVHARARE